MPLEAPQLNGDELSVLRAIRSLYSNDPPADGYPLERVVEVAKDFIKMSRVDEEGFRNYVKSTLHGLCIAKLVEIWQVTAKRNSLVCIYRLNEANIPLVEALLNPAEEKLTLPGDRLRVSLLATR